MLADDSALEEGSACCSAGSNSRVGERHGVPHSAVSKGLALMGLLEPRPHKVAYSWSDLGISIPIEGRARAKA